MEVYNLPDYFLNETKKSVKDDIIFHDYKSLENHDKARISLKRNLFSFLLEGTKQVNHPNKEIKITASQFLTLKTGNCLMTERLSDQQFYHSLLLFFEDRALSDFLLRHEIAIEKNYVENDVITFAMDDYIQNYVHSILTLQKSPKAFSYKLKLLKFEELMLYLIDQYGSSIINYFLGTINTTQEIALKAVVESNVENKLSLDELAFLCNMSLSTFKRKFKNQYGDSPSKWFLSQRLQKAKFLLSVKNQNPSEVFYEVGFENLSSFTQAFKKEYNLTPKKFQLQKK